MGINLCLPEGGHVNLSLSLSVCVFHLCMNSSDKGSYYIFIKQHMKYHILGGMKDTETFKYYIKDKIIDINASQLT